MNYKFTQRKQMTQESRAAQHRVLPIERLVFSGGGAKGVVYPGVYQALVETGAFRSVAEVAGSSVGSMTAAFIAMGISPSKLRRVGNVDFTQLIGQRVGKLLGENPAGVRFFTKDGFNLLRFLRQSIIGAVKSFHKRTAKNDNFLVHHPELKPIFDKLDTPPLFLIPNQNKA